MVFPTNKGRKFENKVQKTIGSGNLWWNKGDLTDRFSLAECKYTDQKGFRITLEILEKAWSTSLNANREPLLCIGIKRNEKEKFVVYCQIAVERS